jgi:hypothetical protein
VRQIGFQTRSLEFNGQEKSSADVNTSHFDASRVCATGRYLIGPESKTRGVRLSIQEVEVVLTDEERRVINRVCSRHYCLGLAVNEVVHDCDIITRRRIIRSGRHIAADNTDAANTAIGYR